MTTPPAPHLSPEDIEFLEAIKATVKLLPDAKAARNIEKTLGDTLALASSGRGDPFGRRDTIELQSSDAPAIRIPISSLPVSLGCSTPEIDVAIDAHSVSAMHCHIERRGQFVLISDAKSERGTFLNGQRITSEYLRDGDMLTIGSVELIVRRV